MGNLPACMCGNQAPVETVTVAMVGPDGAGKTSLCLHLVESDEKPRSTGMEENLKPNRQSAMRMNEWVINVDAARTLRILDLGGRTEYHSVWSKRFGNCLCLVYVLDATAPEKLEEATRVYQRYVLSHVSSARIPLVILLNKVDKANEDVPAVKHLVKEDIVKAFNLTDPNASPDLWDVVETSATTGNGVEDFVESTLHMIAHNAMEDLRTEGQAQ